MLFYKSSPDGWKRVEDREFIMLTQGGVDTTKDPIEEIMMSMAINSDCAIRVEFGCIHDDDVESVAYITSLPNPDSMMAVSKVDRYTGEHIKTFCYGALLDEDKNPVSAEDYEGYITKFKTVSSGKLNGKYISTLNVSRKGITPGIHGG